MKRMLLVVAAAASLALAAPSGAGAHKSKSACRHHHHAHHGCAVLHAHSTVLKFGSPASVNGPASTSTPVTPTSPQETAGTVASFKEGVLTIKLQDGSTVSGKVTEATELRCSSAAPAGEGADEDQGDDHGDDSSSQVTSSRGDDMSGGHGGDDGSGDDGGAGACTTEALTEGTVVAEAELKIGPGGAVWEQIELVK